MPAPRFSALVHLLVPGTAVNSSGDVLTELRRVILDGGAAPGTPIPVDQVAGQFQVSPIPVREALKTLIGEGLVDHRAHSGFTVARLTKNEMSEIYLARGVLERAAVAAAVPLAEAADDLEIYRAYRALEESQRAQDSRAYNRESRRFHFALMRPCRMQRVLHMIESAWNITEPCQPMAQVSDEQRRDLHSDHEVLLSAFRRRDVAELLAVTDRHQRRLEASIALIPSDTGLFAD